MNQIGQIIRYFFQLAQRMGRFRRCLSAMSRQRGNADNLTVDIVCHMGLTTGGAIGAETALTLDDAVERVDRLAAAARSVRPDVIVLCHGGPIAEPEDVRTVLARTQGVVGFFGASSMERLPTERAIADTLREFKSIPV